MTPRQVISKAGLRAVETLHRGRAFRGRVTALSRSRGPHWQTPGGRGEGSGFGRGPEALSFDKGWRLMTALGSWVPTSLSGVEGHQRPAQGWWDMLEYQSHVWHLDLLVFGSFTQILCVLLYFFVCFATFSGIVLWVNDVFIVFCPKC